MKIRVNGKEETLNASCTLTQLLNFKEIEPEKVVVEQNGEIPDRETWNKTVVKDGDEIEILSFMGGG